MTISPIHDLPDYHTHHELCRHATGRTIDYARSAFAAGVKEFAATDHCPTDVSFGRESRMTLNQFPQYLHDVEEARSAYPSLRILLGVEADYYPDCEAFLCDFLQQHTFDIVLGSVHFRNYWSEDPNQRGLSPGVPAPVLWQEYFDLIRRLAETRLYDVVTHLDLPKRFGNPADAATIREAALPALDALADAGMALEINTSGLLLSIHEMYPTLHLLSWAAERNIGLVFGSDSHSPDRVCDGFDQALALAREAGFREARRYWERTWTTYAIV